MVPWVWGGSGKASRGLERKPVEPKEEGFAEEEAQREVAQRPWGVAKGPGKGLGLAQKPVRSEREPARGLVRKEEGCRVDRQVWKAAACLGERCIWH